MDDYISEILAIEDSSDSEGSEPEESLAAWRSRSEASSSSSDRPSTPPGLEDPWSKSDPWSPQLSEKDDRPSAPETETVRQNSGTR